MFNPLYGLTGAPVSGPDQWSQPRPLSAWAPQPQVLGWRDPSPIAANPPQPTYRSGGFSASGTMPWQSQWNSPLAQLYQGGRSSLYRRTW